MPRTRTTLKRYALTCPLPRRFTTRWLIRACLENANAATRGDYWLWDNVGLLRVAAAELDRLLAGRRWLLTSVDYDTFRRERPSPKDVTTKATSGKRQ